MSSHYWIKLYEEILDDSKMATMPDRLWRRTIEIFLLAGRYNNKGILPHTNELAWVLRLPIEELEFDLRQIEMVGIIGRLPDGGWLVNKFAQRQAKMTDAERSQAYRDKQHYNQYYNQDNVTLSDAYVTQITDTYTDIYNNVQETLHKDIPEQPNPIALGKNGDSMNVEEYKKQTEHSIAIGMSKNGYAHFPERIRPVVEKMEKAWNFKPPIRKGKQVGFWIQSCDSILEACGEFDLSLLDELRQLWEEGLNTHNGLAPYPINGPQSLINATQGFAASKRRGEKYVFMYPAGYKVEHQSRLDV